MGIKKLKNILLKPHHIAFSGLTVLILIGVAWYFYSSRRMEGFADVRGSYDPTKFQKGVTVITPDNIMTVCKDKPKGTKVSTPSGSGYGSRNWTCSDNGYIQALPGSNMCPYGSTHVTFPTGPKLCFV